MNSIIIKNTLYVFLICCGCVSHKPKEIELTLCHDEYPVLGKGYKVGSIYETKKSYYIVKNNNEIYMLFQEGGIFPFFVDYIESKEVQDDRRLHEDIVGVVEQGVSIKIWGLFFDTELGGTTAYGKILDGKFSGFDVSLLAISNYLHATPVGYLSIPDPRFIKLREAAVYENKSENQISTEDNQ